MPSPPCLNSPVPSSSSSECSSVVTSTKRARAPRKRPNQSYTEAAVLLSKVYPNVFTTTNTLRRRRHRYSPLSFRSVSPPPPLLAAHLIEHDPSRSPVSCRFGSKPSPPSPLLRGAGFEEQGSPDYDVESIPDEEVGIDSIMGSLSTESNVVSSVFSPIFGGLMGFGTGGGQDSITRLALRGAHRGEWWRASTMVEVKDIVPELDVLPKKKKKKTTSKKKKKKKKKSKMKKKEEVKDDCSSSLSSEGKLKSGLGLKLNYKDVVDAWSDRQFPFTFSPDDLARLADTDLTPDTEGGGAREGSVQRFREKRKTRLFSKKIRYQVRKVNADCRPRMKASGRFAKRSSPHEEAKDGS